LPADRLRCGQLEQATLARQGDEIGWHRAQHLTLSRAFVEHVRHHAHTFEHFVCAVDDHRHVASLNPSTNIRLQLNCV